MSVRIDDLNGIAELPEDSLEDVVGGKPKMQGPDCMWVASSLGGGKSDPIDIRTSGT
ncbi:hypothetical protein SAMN05444920_14135 [Nonomuraea solani]|uniref:Uncharacterized protein n=1 Tax=Nonomuraea solani TaxID=1144553 RepID=A0A1H6F364_9ACTN|nr:hypothetical protein [Nonomuraea solani]SEH03669.1 hypothetical protein SAMN05444920_14135 [Nonomuraea solani]